MVLVGLDLVARGNLDLVATRQWRLPGDSGAYQAQRRPPPFLGTSPEMVERQRLVDSAT